jgi:Na+-transporting NADH:ubiquinone oxidoreductase subunit C
MVVLVALLLAFTSESLRSYQKENEANDKRQQILRSVKVSVSGAETVKRYNELIKESFLVNEQGRKVEGDAFSCDAAKMFAENKYPVFVANVDGKTKYILAMYGAGLWGPIWGYMAVNDDVIMVFGTDFSHQGETPGLGAEIASTAFSSKFAGKQLFKNGAFTSVAIVKPGKSAQGKDYVDGISGGTITSAGVDHMIQQSLEHYVEFLKTIK